MKSVKCPVCGFVGWSDGDRCKSCGVSLTSSIHVSQPWNDTNPPGDLKKGLAIASLVIGIISFFTFGLLGVGAVLGIVLGAVALTKTNRQPSKYGGKGLAIAGLVLSITSFAVAVPIGIIAAIAIPNLLAARRAANEGSTLMSLRQITEAQDAYYNMHQQFGTMEQLTTADLIRPELAAGTNNGYTFKITVSKDEVTDAPSFQAQAMPISYPNSGRRSFYVDETWVVRAADANGAEATKYDPPLDFNREYRVGSSPKDYKQNAED